MMTMMDISNDRRHCNMGRSTRARPFAFDWCSIIIILVATRNWSMVRSLYHQTKTHRIACNNKQCDDKQSNKLDEWLFGYLIVRLIYKNGIISLMGKYGRRIIWYNDDGNWWNCTTTLLCGSTELRPFNRWLPILIVVAIATDISMIINQWRRLFINERWYRRTGFSTDMISLPGLQQQHICHPTYVWLTSN